MEEHGSWYFQSKEVSGFFGGRPIQVADGTRWLRLDPDHRGRDMYSRTCGRLVQIGPEHNRDELYRALPEFGEDLFNSETLDAYRRHGMPIS
eukprot:3169220-Karenia_brevis.AAC.1